MPENSSATGTLMRMELELVLKFTGVVLAWLGAALSSPSGTKQLIQWGKDNSAAKVHKLAALMRKLRENLRALFQPPSQKPSEQKIRPTSIASLSGVGSLSATLYSWSPNADASTRVNELKVRLDDLVKQVNSQFAEAFQSIDAHQEELADIRKTLQELRREVVGRLQNIEQKTARVQAHGLPVIASGIALSGIPAELATIPPLGWSACALGIFISFLCVRSSVLSKAWKD